MIKPGLYFTQGRFAAEVRQVGTYLAGGVEATGKRRWCLWDAITGELVLCAGVRREHRRYRLQERVRTLGGGEDERREAALH